MFARFTRLPLRRCLHTASTAGRSANPFGRVAKVAIGASAVTATYMTWRLTQEGNSIALDSTQSTNSAQPSQNLPKASSKPSRPAPAPSEASSSSKPLPSESEASSGASSNDFIPDPVETDGAVSSEEKDEEGEGETPVPGGASGGAFNPVTGEINWDCPCLGGMAHGPCGPEFREAFSCFVYSEDEPKGINCVDKFQAMQNCFRAHPDVYADEIMNDDDDEEPAQADGSNVPPTQSEEKLTTDASPEMNSTGKAHLEDVHTAQDS